MSLQNSKEANVQNNLSLRNRYILRIAKEFQIAINNKNVMFSDEEKEKKIQFLLYFHVSSLRKN